MVFNDGRPRYRNDDKCILYRCIIIPFGDKDKTGGGADAVR